MCIILCGYYTMLVGAVLYFVARAHVYIIYIYIYISYYMCTVLLGHG